eukprot:5689512-Amphidinium_carterae.1
MRREKLRWALQQLTERRSDARQVPSGDAHQYSYRAKSLAWTLARIASRKQSKVVQRMVRSDKNAWLQEKTDELAVHCAEGDSSIIHKHVKKCLVKLRPNPTATQRAQLVDAEGKVYTTQDEKEMLWQTHWSRLYGATVKNNIEDF